MPVLTFEPAALGDTAARHTSGGRAYAVEITPNALHALQHAAETTGGYLNRRHIETLERLARAQLRDAELHRVADYIEAYDSVYVRFL